MIEEENKQKYQQMVQYQLSNELIYACLLGDLEIVGYLLTSPDLKDHADIHFNNDCALASACTYGHVEIIKYLIFDYQIEKTKDIENYLVENEKEEILNLFEKREFEEKLQNELRDVNIASNKIKL